MLVENEAIDENFDFYMKYSLISCGTKQLLNMQRMIQKYLCKIISWRFVLQGFQTAVGYSFQQWNALIISVLFGYAETRHASTTTCYGQS